MDEGKYTYEFADGEISEINTEDIPPEILEFLKEDDMRIRTNNNRETRRHIHWEQFENGYETISIPDRSETAPEAVHREMLCRMMFAIEMLTSDQKELLRKVYVEEIRQQQIALEQGVVKQAISNRLERIYKKIQKSFA